MRGSMALYGMQSAHSRGTDGPQAIFLKANSRAGRPDDPTVPHPHRTASIEGRNSAW